MQTAGDWRMQAVNSRHEVKGNSGLNDFSPGGLI
jgi:hypothetical protein